MFDPKDFYSSYQYDYHIYKLMTLKSIIDNVERFESEILKDSIQGFDKKDYLRMIRSEVRQTLYHSIETVFELVFALASNTNGTYDDTNILFKLTNSDWRENNRRIAEIAESEDGLKFLDIPISANGHIISLAHYLFYYGILPDNTKIPKDTINLIPSSLEAIKYGLKSLAEEFVERNEYNSYKHGIRIIPILKEFSIHDVVTKENLARFDLSESMTFMKPIDKKDPNEKIEFVTQIFDTNRDIGIAVFCANLISNLILLRKAGFKKIGTDETFPILFFGIEELKKVSMIGVPISKFIYKIENVPENELAITSDAHKQG